MIFSLELCRFRSPVNSGVMCFLLPIGKFMRIIKGLLLISTLLMAFTAALSCSMWQDDWQYTPDAFLTSGSQMHAFKDVRGQLLSANGYRRISRAKLEEMSLYHAIIFYPKAPVIGGGGESKNDGPISKEIVSWVIQKNPPNDYKNKEEKTLELKFHGLEKTLIVGSETFALSNGNIFIIRLDENWLPTVTQIPNSFYKRAEDKEVLEFIKSVLKDDAAIQKLELY